MNIEYKAYDKKFFEENLEEFLPEKIIDIHSHVWLKEQENLKTENSGRVAGWISLIAKENSFEDLIETYKVLLPGRKVSSLVFSNVSDSINSELGNEYVLNKTRGTDFRALALVHPEESAEAIAGYLSKGFLGIKVYLNYAPRYIPTNEIRIFDFLPRHQLEVLDKECAICMLHIPRSMRLRDPVNLAQLVEIDARYPNIKLIVAHIGRAYALEDVGDAMSVLSKTKHMMFDFSANTNAEVMAELIRAVGPQRVMFGTDLPIFRMRAHRIVENGVYCNIVVKGQYGDMSKEPNMRETDKGEAITFLFYEMLDAFRRASIKMSLSKHDVEDVFYNNASKLLY